MQWTFIKVYLHTTWLLIKRFTIKYADFLGDFEDFDALVDFPVAIKDVERSSPPKSLKLDYESETAFFLKR
mgnify:FL=1